VSQPPRFERVGGNTAVVTRHPDHLHRPVVVLPALLVRGMGDHDYLMAEAGQAVGLGVGLGADAAAGGLGRVLLRDQGQPHGHPFRAASTSRGSTLLASKYSSAMARAALA